MQIKIGSKIRRNVDFSLNDFFHSKLQLVPFQMTALITFLGKRKKIPVMVFNCSMRRFTVPNNNKIIRYDLKTPRTFNQLIHFTLKHFSADLIPNGIRFQWYLTERTLFILNNMPEATGNIIAKRDLDPSDPNICVICHSSLVRQRSS